MPELLRRIAKSNIIKNVSPIFAYRIVGTRKWPIKNALSH